ncbi:unnamed protein product [Mytilus edulis]|uniref:Uncharacterized protein n=1 Tax=Mytilus edulis TaxID=6550 RepID=A0A8S3TD04_MYTED|nr:unnamed protein product [Mytilus edulis]
MHQPSNESSTQGEYGRGTMHQPSNESLTWRIQQEQCINHQMGLQHRKNTAGNNASTIKWVFNTGEYTETMHQPSNESSTQENTAGTMHQPSNESSTQGEYSRGTMHQPSNGSSTQEEYSRNNASTIKWVFNTGEYSREQCINHQMSLQHMRIQQGTMHQPSNGSSTQENTAGNNASTIKWVFNTGRIQQGTMHQPSNESSTQEEYSRGTMHQPSNGSSTQGEYSREQCINHQMSLQHRKNTECINHQLQLGRIQCINHQMSLQHRKEYSRGNASTIKWVFNTGEYSREQCINHQMVFNIKWAFFNTGKEYSRGTMHQPSNGSSTQGEYSREQCINHQMGLQHRKNTAGNNASTIKWVFNTGRIQQANHQMHQTIKSWVFNTGRIQQGEYNASTIKWVFNTGRIQQGTMHQPSNGSSTQENTAGEQCINHQNGSSTQENTAGTMHQPSNGSSTQENTAGNNASTIKWSSTQENTAGNNASTIKWVFNTGRIQQQTMHQPSNESSNTGEYSREQCINHQNESSNTGRSLHQPSNGSSTQGEYSRNNASTIKWVINTGRIQQGTHNASTIKWVFNTGEYSRGTMHQPSNGSSTQGEYSREQCINHQMSLQHREQGQCINPSNASTPR